MTCPGWIRQSRKAQIALGTVVTTVLTRVLRWAGMPADDCAAIVAAVLTIGSVWIGSIAVEDAAAKLGGAEPTPPPDCKSPQRPA